MARYIDAELFADRLLNAWDTADKEKKSEIVAILSNIVTPILVGTPTADVVPRAEVEKIFEEIGKTADACIESEWLRGSWFNMSKFKESLAELKNKYAEGGND